LIRDRLGSEFGRILAVGCGSGLEALALAQEFKSKVVGIDLDPTGFNPEAAEKADLKKGDATQLEFSNEEFDLIYSCHALEHIPQFEKALREMGRVLRKGGGFFIETPNCARLIGYLGSETATWKQKIVWNWYDWKARWEGTFRNDLGAHAGFFSDELKKELEKVFGYSEEITLPYYLELYNPRASLIKGLDRSGLGKYLFPSIFFIGRK
jgi:ubiquinone/menaquinone biosynthesis C-methylase UbiE